MYVGYARATIFIQKEQKKNITGGGGEDKEEEEEEETKNHDRTRELREVGGTGENVKG